MSRKQHLINIFYWPVIARCCFVEWEKDEALLRYLAYLLDIYRSTLSINKLVMGIVSVQVIDGLSIVPAWPLLWASAGLIEWTQSEGLLHCRYGMLSALGASGLGSLGGVVLPPHEAGDPHGSTLSGPWGHQGAPYSRYRSTRDTHYCWLLSLLSLQSGAAWYWYELVGPVLYKFLPVSCAIH